MLCEGVATTEAINTVMKLDMNPSMGPPQLSDFIAIGNNSEGEPRPRPQFSWGTSCISR
jgi:hypothetical protein